MQTRLFLLLLITLTLTACMRDPNLVFIQGTWASVSSGERSFQWQFNNGTFTRQQAFDNNRTLYTTGQYQLVESEGDELTLELFDYSGDRISYEDSPMTIRIEIDRLNDTARIANTPFVRVSP